MYYDEPMDYGFEQPDKRWYKYDTHGREISVVIYREWFMDEYGDSDYRCLWLVMVDGAKYPNLQPFKSESKAIAVASAYFDYDEDAESNYNGMGEARYGSSLY
jgi:hypothetical protein